MKTDHLKDSVKNVTLNYITQEVTKVLVLYKGSRGKGKSLTMVKDGKRFSELGWKILSNFKTDFGNKVSSEFILNLDKDTKIRDTFLLIDEIQILFDSRAFANKQAMIFSHFLQQIRKRNIHILCCSQFANTIDLRIRQQVDIVAFPNFDKITNLCEVVYYDLTKLEDINGINEMKGIKVIFDAKPIFEMYDTEEIIK